MNRDGTDRDGSGRDEPLELRRTADGSRTLFDPSVGQTFHSEHGARSETEHVFLRGSGMLDRLRPGATLRIVEIGLGTGANLLASWQAARHTGTGLVYRAVERRPPPVAVVREMLQDGDRVDADRIDAELVEAWMAMLEELRRSGDAPDPAYRTFTPAEDLHLEVALGDAASGPDGAPSPAAARVLQPGWADVIYHDAFSRDASPALWSAPFLGACARALAPGGAWVSYSVAGDVRRRLTGAGLTVRKLPGPAGGKKEMLRAERPPER